MSQQSSTTTNNRNTKYSITNNNANGKISHDRRLSKALSKILRHSAPSLGLTVSTDGYVPVQSILRVLSSTSSDNKKNNTNQNANQKRIKQNQYTIQDIQNVVTTNDKQRFQLSQRKIILKDPNNWMNYTFVPLKQQQQEEEKEMRILPLVVENETDNNVNNNSDNSVEEKEVLCIRANQGHSIQGIIAEELLTLIPYHELKSMNDNNIIHGTFYNAWYNHIQHEGLSRMKRNHIHFATGLPSSSRSNNNNDDENHNHVISGMRQSCEVYIYINASKCAQDNIQFYKSANGVILTAGIHNGGILPLNYFSKVIDAKSKEILFDSTSINTK